MRLQVCCWICNQTGTENRGKVIGIDNPQAATDWQQIRAMVEVAYRLGLKDGLVRVGDLA